MSDWETGEDELIAVGKGTRPVTPVGGRGGAKPPSILGGKSKDPVSSDKG